LRTREIQAIITASVPRFHHQFNADEVFGTHKVRARLIVVIQIRPQQMTEMAFAKDNHVINTFPPDRPDQPLSIAALPRRSRGCWAIADAHDTNTSLEYLTID
jgi:hypothetical protein